jgi:hypothetical protein
MQDGHCGIPIYPTLTQDSHMTPCVGENVMTVMQAIDPISKKWHFTANAAALIGGTISVMDSSNSVSWSMMGLTQRAAMTILIWH